jgi:hypothetical protein
MTTPPELPEAIVEKAARALTQREALCLIGEKQRPLWQEQFYKSAEEFVENRWELYLSPARAALSAVAPILIAQGMKKAAGISIAWPEGSDGAKIVGAFRMACLARAAEIEQQKE